MAGKPELSAAAQRNPFGAASRRELLDAYFAENGIRPGQAWLDVYRLLLWIDPTTGLAHCYESDKSQPGRHWYGRSLAFHAYLARALGVAPKDAGQHIDWLFKRVQERQAAKLEATMQRQASRAAQQRAAYPDSPIPYDDPRLREIIARLDPQHTYEATTSRALRDIRLHIASENKRKNLLGEGFEDTIAAILRQLGGQEVAEIRTQADIAELEGFRAPRAGEKRQKIDLWVRTASGRRILVTAKWSVRADREKQLADDYRIYVDCNAAPTPFEYVFLTNEFDAARLVANTGRLEANRPLFDAVVHVSPEALLAAHSLAGQETLSGTADAAPVERRSAARLPDLVRSRRLLSLDSWLSDLTQTPGG